jgi:hypothetical protein
MAMTKEDHARVREFKERVRKLIGAGETPTPGTGRAVAEGMRAEGRQLPAEIEAAAGWSQ